MAYKIGHWWGVVVAKLVEWSLQIPEVRAAVRIQSSAKIYIKTIGHWYL